MSHQASARFADQLERSLRGGAWHGPALLEALDGVDLDLANRRVIADAHTIAEIVGHLSSWLELSRRRIEGSSTPATEADDWPPESAPANEEAWRDALATLEARHRRLLAAVRSLDDDGLAAPVPGADPTVRGLLLGILQHQAYHGGQIALLRRAAEAS